MAARFFEEMVAPCESTNGQVCISIASHAGLLSGFLVLPTKS